MESAAAVPVVGPSLNHRVEAGHAAAAQEPFRPTGGHDRNDQEPLDHPGKRRLSAVDRLLG